MACRRAAVVCACPHLALRLALRLPPPPPPPPPLPPGGRDYRDHVIVGQYASGG